jgi:hypothetical protein
MSAANSPNRNLKRKWWVKVIRAISFFHFRNYFWLLPLYIFLIFLSWWFLLSAKCFSCGVQCPDCPKCEEVVSNPVDSLHFEADYLVITYQFNQSGGKDLDTRTQIISPITSSKLGYCLRGEENSSSLYWSGDNRGYGVESCVVDLNSFGQTDRVVVQCDAFWFSEKNSGQMSIDIRAYKGGEMSVIDYQFFNNGGVQTANVSFEDYVDKLKDDCITGERIGLIIYDKANQKLSFEKQ